MNNEFSKHLNTKLGIESRRGFLKTVSAGVVFGSSLTTFATDPANEPNFGQDKAKKGGAFITALSSGSTSDNFNPSTWNNAFAITAGKLVYNYLLNVDDKRNLAPELASEWSRSADGLSWRIKLRSGVFFHNGQEFTADDAIYSLMVHKTSDTSGGAALLNNWTSILKVSKYEFKIILSNPDQDLPWTLTDYHFAMIPNDFNVWNSPIGTGAYKIKRFNPSKIVEAVRNTNYWREGLPNFDKAIIVSIPDHSKRLNALIKGSVHVIDNVPFSVADLLKQSSHIDLVISETGRYYNNPMRIDQPPFDDENIRLAIKYATNRENLVKNVLYGYGKLGNDQPLATNSKFYNPNLPQLEFDIDRSKFYLKKAGLTKLDLTLHTSQIAYTNALKAGFIMKEDFKQCNINLTVINEKSDTYWNEIWNKKAFTTCSWQPRATAGMTFKTTYSNSSVWNDTAFNNPRFEKLLKTLRFDERQDIRIEAAWEMQEIIHAHSGQLIPMFPLVISAKSKSVMGFTPHPLATMNNYTLSEKAWFSHNRTT